MRSPWARQRGADGPGLVAAEAQLGELRRGLGRPIDSHAEGLVERAEFEPRVAGFRQPIGGWEAQPEAVRDEAPHVTLPLAIGRLEGFARRVRDRAADADRDTRRAPIRLPVKRVEISRAACRTRDRGRRVRSPKPCDTVTERVR